MPTRDNKSSKAFFFRIWHNFQEFRRRHPVICVTIIFCIGILLTFALDKCLRIYYEHFLKTILAFNIKRFILVGAVTETFLLIVSYGKKGIEYFYKYRYLVGVALFVLCVVLRVNYSSSGILDSVIQPNHPTQTENTLIGTNRRIRSDEYVVNTPMIISQYRNDFSLVNPDMMADNVVTSFYPKLPNKSPLSFLTSPQYLGFMFLPFENAFSFYQLLPWFIAFFAVFEMLMVITKKRKLMSLVGSLFIIFSPVVLWFDSVQYVMYIALLFDIFNLYIHCGKIWKSKLVFSLLFGWIAACFVMVIYPAWQVPYGYVLLVLLICLIVGNRKRLRWHDLLYALPVVGIIAVLVAPSIIISLEQYHLTTQTVYPGQRSISGGGGLAWIFYSIPSIFFPINEVSNSCEASGFVSLFPIPIFLGIYIIFRSAKKKQYDPWLIGLIVLSIFFSFMYFIGNGLLAKVTLLFLTPSERLRPVLELTCVLIAIRLLSSYRAVKTPKRPALLAIIVVVITALFVYFGTNQINDYAKTLYMHPALMCAAFIVYYISVYCLVDNRKSTCYVIGTLAVLFAGYQFLTIHPLKTGLDVYMDKPVAQKIRELSSENQDALWLTSGTVLSSYALTNGARVINSVNYYPVMDRWHLLDPDRKYEDIYNRYAHISITLTNKEPTRFQLVVPDTFDLTLNYKDVCLLNPTYFLSNTKYEPIPELPQKLIYEEDGIYIYQFNCHGDS